MSCELHLLAPSTVDFGRLYNSFHERLEMFVSNLLAALLGKLVLLRFVHFASVAGWTHMAEGRLARARARAPAAPLRFNQNAVSDEMEMIFQRE